MGNNSLKFIAWCARAGCSDDHIRIMYTWVLHHNQLSSSKVDTWRKSLDKWLLTVDEGIYWDWWNDGNQ